MVHPLGGWLRLAAIAGIASIANVTGCGSDSEAEPGGGGAGGAAGAAGAAGGNLDGGAGTCAPKTCAQLEAVCGSAPDTCGGKVECGDCAIGQTCGGAGVNKCGTNACTPKTCAQIGASCGYVSDQCSLAVDCGTCPSGQTCGGGGVPNQCGSGESSCSMTLGEVSKDTTIPAGCVVDVPENANVLGDATLTVEEGVRVRVAPGKHIYVGLEGPARLVVKGSASKPVTFTSSASSPSAGDWVSLYLGADLMGGTSIDHAVFEYAGAEAQPAIEIVSEKPGRVAITNSTFRHNAAGAIVNDNQLATFQQMTGDTMEDNGDWSVKIDANVVGSVGEGNTFGVPFRVTGTSVKTTATWLKHDVPYRLESIVNVADESVPVLTLTPGTEIRFSMGGGLRMGVTWGGALIAEDIMFTSSAPTPAPGDWEMIWFSDKAATSTLSGCTIEYAGSDQGIYPGVLKVDDQVVSKVKVTGTTFRHNMGEVDIQTVGGDCAQYTNASPPNTFDLATHCE